MAAMRIEDRPENIEGFDRYLELRGLNYFNVATRQRIRCSMLIGGDRVCFQNMLRFNDTFPSCTWLQRTPFIVRGFRPILRGACSLEFMSDKLITVALRCRYDKPSAREVLQTQLFCEMQPMHAYVCHLNFDGESRLTIQFLNANDLSKTLFMIDIQPMEAESEGGKMGNFDECDEDDEPVPTDGEAFNEEAERSTIPYGDESMSETDGDIESVASGTDDDI